jgi:hypothetical protein
MVSKPTDGMLDVQKEQYVKPESYSPSESSSGEIGK